MFRYPRHSNTGGGDMIPEWIGWWDGYQLHLSNISKVIVILMWFIGGNIWVRRHERRRTDELQKRIREEMLENGQGDGD